jgi:hypothetical protein
MGMILESLGGQVEIILFLDFIQPVLELEIEFK